ncbi:MAG: class I SAM-dependent methyltransferase [Bacteroidota bacterium]
MTYNPSQIVEKKLRTLHADARFDSIRINPFKASSGDAVAFERAYLPISKDQGHFIRNLIIEKDCKEIVEFGTSFGISTIYLADAVRHTGGRVITTELLPSKAEKALQNLKDAGLNDYVEIRVGDAMQTLEDYTSQIDFLLLDGWKDLYLPLFQLLERQFHTSTLVYADNMDMASTQIYGQFVQRERSHYPTQILHGGKAFLTHVS